MPAREFLERMSDEWQGGKGGQPIRLKERACGGNTRGTAPASVLYILLSASAQSEGLIVKRLNFCTHTFRQRSSLENERGERADKTSNH